MRFGLDVSQHQLTWDELLGRVTFAEDAGFDGAWVFDHFEPLYGDPTGPCLEGWTALAGLAAATSRIRVGTLVTGITYRHPSVLATQAVTVDHISGGRLEFAVGAAWFEGEHRRLGIDFPPASQRVDLLEEALTVMRLVMTEDDATFEGEHLNLRGASYRPRPIQQPHPPIWVGANGEKRMIPLAARTADVWHGSGDSTVLKRKNQIIDREAERAGRDPAEITRATWLSISEPLDDVRRHLESLDGVGIGYVTVSWPEQGQERVEAFVRDVMSGYDPVN